MSEPSKQEGPRAGLLLLAGVAVVLCCAGPALVAGGALAGIGAALANPLVMGAGVTVLVVGLAHAARRNRRTTGCRPPAVSGQQPGQDGE